MIGTMTKEAVGVTEIAAELGWTVQRVYNHYARQTKASGMPEPDRWVGPKRRPYWDRETIQPWIEAQRAKPG